MSNKNFDIVIMGGGILGVSVAYELSRLSHSKSIALIEGERELAFHTSGRNTGVIHRPFYLNPEKKKVFAECANLSYAFWKEFAAKHNLPWNPVGTLEVAFDKKQIDHLKKYLVWARENGMKEDEVQLLSGAEAKKIEPNVKCLGALLCKTDVSVDFGLFTKKLGEEARQRGVQFIMGHSVKRITSKNRRVLVELGNQEAIEANYIINCAGGGALKIAKMCGLGEGLSSLSVRGEYWKIDSKFKDFAKRNIYSVPGNPNFPFLDPHWIVRHDGQVEIGPNAVPLLGKEMFQGFFNKLRLFLNPEFVLLALKEWRSSFSKSVMAGRVRKFLPDLKSEWLKGRGTAGVRTTIITEEGSLAPEAIELQNKNSIHILNYNSPGATGAPEFAKRLVQKIKGLI